MNPDLNNLDDLIRRQLNESDATGGDWDLPSDHVWEGISARVNDRRRRGLWWILPIGLVLVLAIVIFISGSKADDLEQPVAEKNNLFLTELDEKSAAADRDHQNPSHEVDNVLVSETVPAPISQDNAVVNQFRSPDSLIVSDKREQVVQSRGNDTTNPNVSEHNRSGESGVRLSGPGAVNVSSANSTRQGLEAVKNHSNVTGSAANTGHTPEDISETPESLLAVRATGSEMHALNSVAMPLEWKRDIGLEALSGPALVPVCMDCDAVWGVSASIAPSWGTRRIVVPRNQPGVRRELLLSRERAIPQLGFGVSLSRSINPRWSVSGGIEYNSYVIENSARHQVRFTRFGERLNGRGNLENTLDLNLNTSYGDLSTGIVIERSPTSDIDEHRFIDIDIVARQSLSVVQIPLSLKYRLPLGSWSGSVQGGFSANLRVDDEFELRLLRPTHTDILAARLSDRASPSGARKMSMGYHIGVGLEKSFNCHWALLVEPMLSGYLQPVYRTKTIEVYPALFDIHVGIQYKW